eukprot:979323-Pyramimonas_sp.AAC.1
MGSGVLRCSRSFLGIGWGSDVRPMLFIYCNWQSNANKPTIDRQSTASRRLAARWLSTGGRLAPRGPRRGQGTSDT